MGELDAELRELLEQVNEHISGKSAVSKEEVYPRFDRLGSLTLAMMDEAKMLEVRAKLFHSLINMVGGFTRSLRLAAVERAFDTLRQVGKEDGSGSLPIVPWQGTPAAPPPDANPEKEAQRFGLDILPAEDPENPYELQLGGYCIVSVVQRGGVLIPADPAIGVARIQVRTTKKRRKKRREKEREKRSWGLAYHGGVGWGVGGSRRMDETRPRYGWRSLSLSLSLSFSHSLFLSVSISLSLSHRVCCSCGSG